MLNDSKRSREVDVTAGHDVIDVAKYGVVCTQPAYRLQRRVTDPLLAGYHGARRHPRPSRPMFWESRGRARVELGDRPTPPECLHGVLTTDYTPRSLPPITVMRRRQREKAAVRIPFGPPGGAR